MNSNEFLPDSDIQVMRSALSHLEGRPLHVSYDIDSCDPGRAL